jgi:hypothetical protein
MDAVQVGELLAVITTMDDARVGLVGDRFAMAGGGWCDLAVGGAADVTLCPIARDVVEREAACREASAVWWDGIEGLRDYGPHGCHVWFEARDRVPRRSDPPWFGIRRPRWRGADLMARHAEGDLGAGVRCLAVVCAGGGSPWPMLSDAANALRRIGFVTLRTGVPIPIALRPELRHRHLALLVSPCARSRTAAAAWVGDLTRVSRRSHLVVLVGGTPPRGAPAIDVTPFSIDELTESFLPAEWRPPSDVVAAAARASGGWPRQFAATLDTARIHGGHRFS